MASGRDARYCTILAAMCTAPRSRAAWVAALLAALSLTAASCITSGDSAPDLPPFPAEKSAADFPGIAYALSSERPGPPTGRVWLVGVDGATWQLARPLIERGELPVLAALVAKGAHGTLLSEEPTISPSLWATVATGVPRHVHGVLNFMERVPGTLETVAAGPPDRRAPALWELVGAAGGRSAVVSWFGSYPAESIDGYYVSKAADPARLDPRQVHPPELVERLSDVQPEWIDPQLAGRIGRNPFLERTLLEDARTLAVLRTLVADGARDLDFVAAYLSGIDVVQHVAWRHMDPASQQFPQDGPPDPTLAEVIADYYRWVDAALGEVVALLPADATLVVVSDHGAGPMMPAEAYHLQLDVLLEALGLMQGADGVAFAIDESYRHDKRIWILAAGAAPGATLPASEAPRIAESVAGRLRALRTDAGDAVFEQVDLLAETAGWDADEPALVVRFAAQALVATHIVDGAREIDFDPVRLRHSDVSGAHRPEGIVILQGPGIRPGPLPAAAHLYQIAPTVLHLLGLPQDARMLAHAPADGGVLQAALAESLVAADAIRQVAGYPGTDRSMLLRGARRSASEHPDPAREEQLERLRSLGYVR